MKKNVFRIIALVAVVSMPLLAFGWEYAKTVTSSQRVLVPLNDDAAEVSVVEIGSNQFAVVVSKYGVGICQVK